MATSYMKMNLKLTLAKGLASKGMYIASQYSKGIFCVGSSKEDAISQLKKFHYTADDVSVESASDMLAIWAKENLGKFCPTFFGKVAMLNSEYEEITAVVNANGHKSDDALMKDFNLTHDWELMMIFKGSDTPLDTELENETKNENFKGD